MSRAAERPVTTLREWESGLSFRERVRSRVRDAAVFALSTRSRFARDGNWLRFPYYHHVFDDERKGFSAHLRAMRNVGEIISLDDATTLMESEDPVDGRYFCITFDDGFRNCHTNAVPILVDHRATAAFFLPTQYIGSDPEKDRDVVLGFYAHGNIMMDFLNWEECREMDRAGMTIGSHTVTHPRLATLSESEVERELGQSKAEIERELGRPCEHFCCPTGRPVLDFQVDRDPEIARRLGYRTFLTTRRGSIAHKPDPYMVERDHLMAGWGVFQLRYFLAR